MSLELTGSGDPARSLPLLWRDRLGGRPRRGRRPALSVDAIVATAVELADDAGLGALSMRAIADRLGAGTMSLYTHVPGKAELVDLMVDSVMGELAAPARRSGGWRAQLEHVARENAALFRRHSWMLEVATLRPPLGPNVIAKYDTELRALDGIGLSDVEMDSVLSLVLSFVHGQARARFESDVIEQRTGQSDEAWWAAQEPLVDELFDAERFSVAARVGTAASEAYQGLWDPDYAFEFGLARVLDGIEALVASR